MLKKFPNTFLLIFYVILFSAILTWIVPGGKYTTQVQLVEGEAIEVMQFTYTENVKQTWQVFSALYDGFQRQSGIIVFILMIGGAFWVLNSTRAMDLGIMVFLKQAKRAEKYRLFRQLGVNNVLLSLIMLMFSLFGALFGMSEETIAFIIIMVPMTIAMGYDSITGVFIVYIGASLGFAGAVLNPFTVGIAQSIAGIPMFSGLQYRIFCWIAINIIGLFFLLRYANKVRKRPEQSPVYAEDAYWRNHVADNTEAIVYYTPKGAWVAYSLVTLSLGIYSWYYPGISFMANGAPIPLLPCLTLLFAILGIGALRKSVHFFILLLLFTTIAALIIGVIGYDWYIMEIAALFFAMGITSGIAVGHTGNRMVKIFTEGISDILPAAMAVGLAGGIIIILERGEVIDTILHYLSGTMKGMGKIATVSSMYIIQSLINVVIPSGSAKAAITMPIMAPFSDLVGLSRQATVMAFQFGDGFTNMIIPTSPVLLGVLGVARIPYDKWVKWITPFMVVLIMLGFLLLIPTVTMPLKGF